MHFTLGLAEFDCWVKCSHYSLCISLQSTLQPFIMKNNLLLMSESVCGTRVLSKRPNLSWMKLNEPVTKNFPSMWICNSSVRSQPLNGPIKRGYNLKCFAFLGYFFLIHQNQVEMRGVYWMSLIFENQKWEMQNKQQKKNHYHWKEMCVNLIRWLHVTSSWAGVGVYSILFCICDDFSD